MYTVTEDTLPLVGVSVVILTVKPSSIFPDEIVFRLGMDQVYLIIPINDRATMFVNAYLGMVVIC